MIIVFKLILITSMLILGWKIVTSEGMLLEKVGDWAEKHKIAPLYCQWCMPSLWAFFGYAEAYITRIVHINLYVVYAYPLVVCGSSIFCGMLWDFYLTMNRVKEKFESDITEKNN